MNSSRSSSGSPFPRRTGPSLKWRLSRREITVGSWLTLGSQSATEIMCQADFDWLVIDMEHSSTTFEQAADLVRIIELSGVTPLIRLAENQATLIKLAMDLGSHGVVVPMVNSASEAAAAVEALRYPPRGTRGVGLFRAQRYGFGFDEYVKWIAENAVLIVQIEHKDAVESLEAILEVEGVDGFIIGPYDLSGSFGVPGEFEHPDVVRALEQVNMVRLKTNALAGYHVVSPEPSEVDEKVRAGYRFVAYSVDAILLGEAARSGLATIRQNVKNMTEAT